MAPWTSPPSSTSSASDGGELRHPAVPGPSALGDDLRRFVALTYTLAVTDFKLRFFGSALGYLWTLMRPLLLFGVLYIVFTEIVKFGGGVDHYPVYLLMAIVLFTLFLRDHEPLRDLARSKTRTCCARCAFRAW